MKYDNSIDEVKNRIAIILAKQFFQEVKKEEFLMPDQMKIAFELFAKNYPVNGPFFVGIDDNINS